MADGEYGEFSTSSDLVPVAILRSYSPSDPAVRKKTRHPIRIQYFKVQLSRSHGTNVQHRYRENSHCRTSVYNIGTVSSLSPGSDSELPLPFQFNGMTDVGSTVDLFCLTECQPLKQLHQYKLPVYRGPRGRVTLDFETGWIRPSWVPGYPGINFKIPESRAKV
eukprot:1625027-Rhodomonas_salina.2